MAYLAATDTFQEGKFVWLDGPEAGQVVSTSNSWWIPNVLSDDGSIDDCLAIGYWGYLIDAPCSNPNRLSNDNAKFGYLVEIYSDSACMLWCMYLMRLYLFRFVNERS